ncbi:MAG: phage antirepressor KilAC domain-containing protein [Spirochaetaceae bacterium]|nr:phage antirepressor KilAC domain-containing protein [Spirochaetaceae bacterium]
MKELELWSDTPKEKTMTVKEVSLVLNVSIELITKTIREVFPGKMKKGITTKLNEKEVTAISLRIKQNKHLTTSYDHTKLENVVSPVPHIPKTDLEKKLIIKQALIILNEEIETLKPKAEKYDSFISSAGTMDMKEVSDVLNIKNVGRNNLMHILRAQGVLSESNKPYQNLINLGYFKEVPVETHVGVKCKPVAFTRGVSFIKKAVDNFFENGGKL